MFQSMKPDYNMRFSVENGEILIFAGNESTIECARGYTKFTTPQKTYHSRDFQWEFKVNDKESYEIVGKCHELSLTQYWHFKKTTGNELEWSSRFSMDKELEITEIYLGVACSPKYWHWNNSFRYGAFISPSNQMDQLSWFGNPLDIGLSVSTGLMTFPDIRLTHKPGNLHSSTKITTNPENQCNELRYYRTEPIYGQGSLPKGEYTIFQGTITLEKPNVINLMEVSKQFNDWENSEILVINSCGLSMFDYFVEGMKLNKEKTVSVNAESVVQNRIGPRQSR